MMKFLLMMIFMISLSFKNNYCWLNQYFYFLMLIMFLMNFSFNYLVTNIIYFLENDLLGYMMVLLSFWICSLMILASSKLFNKNYYNLFLFFILMLMISVLYVLLVQ